MSCPQTGASCPAVKFTVHGEPRGKARPRAAWGKSSSTHMYAPAHSSAYESYISAQYLSQTGGSKFKAGEALEMRIDAYHAIPASAPSARKTAMEDGEIRPVKKPDIDNIAKSVLDALNNVAYRDDSQVVECHARKFYSSQPRVEITILVAQTKMVHDAEKRKGDSNDN